MVDFVLSCLFWLFFIFGVYSFIIDIFKLNTYKKIKEKIKIIMIGHDVEEGIESYIREISYGKNFYNNLVFIDNDSKDNTLDVLHELIREEFNIKVLNKKEGKEYLEKTIK